MSAYTRLCLWVQKMQAGSMATGKLLYLIGVLPMFLTPLIGKWWLIPSVIIAAIWAIFVTWRLWKMMQTGFIEANLRVNRDIKNG